MKVYIMRGLPGSGKSSWVATQSKTPECWVVCSADHFHMVGDEYRFDPKNAGAAHSRCLYKFVEALSRNEVDVLVVDNTNTTAVELAPYVRLCEAFGVEYEIVWVIASPLTAYRRNVHGVPYDVIHRMWGNLMTERLPAGWRQRCVLPNSF